MSTTLENIGEMKLDGTLPEPELRKYFRVLNFVGEHLLWLEHRAVESKGARRRLTRTRALYVTLERFINTYQKEAL